MYKEIILVGGGGHCHACIDVIEQEGNFSIAGIVDMPQKVGQKVLGYPIIGSDQDLEYLAKKYQYFLIAVGQLKTATTRQRIYQELTAYGALLPTIISPLAYCSPHSQIGAGTIVMHHAIVNARAKIGLNCIVNNKALVEHDAQVGNHNHLSTACVLNGNVVLGTGCTIGSRAVTLQGIKITDQVVVGAGAVVHRDLLQSGTYVGVPATRINV